MSDPNLPPKRLAAMRRAAILAQKIDLLLGSIMTETGEPFDYPAVRDGAQKAGYYLSRSRWSRLRNGKEQPISGEGLRSLASVFGVDAKYLLMEDGPVPEQVKAALEALKKRKRAEVREFAAKALDVVDPGTFEQISRVLAEGPLALETPERGSNSSQRMSISSARTSFQSSELSRASAEVFAAAVERPVRVIRCDGEPLLLMAETIHRERSLLMELSAQLLFAPAENEVSLVNWMGDKLPWMLALSPAERDTCATNIVTAVRASLATDQPRRALAEVASWREMAVAAAANHGRKPAEDTGGELPTFGSREGQSATSANAP